MARGRRSSAEIPEGVLRELYGEQGLSAETIATRLGWSASAVRTRLIALGIARRTPWARQAVTCDLDTLQRLYLVDGLTMSEIAARVGCSLTTVWRKLTAAGTPVRGATVRYERRDFSGDAVEQAYLIGFRLGDLNVERDGETIVVKCTSTRAEQVELFRELFAGYGHVYTDEATRARRARQSIGMQVALNRTFAFLLPKEDRVPEWVLGTDDTFFAFFAGYLDAEGYVHTYLRRGYLTPQVWVEIRTYDRTLLVQLADGLNARGIFCSGARLRVQAGYVNRAGVISNRDLWGFGVGRTDALARLFERIDPYVRHARRRRDMLNAWSVVRSKISS